MSGRSDPVYFPAVVLPVNIQDPIWYALDDYEVSDLKGGGLRTLGTR